MVVAAIPHPAADILGSAPRASVRTSRPPTSLTSTLPQAGPPTASTRMTADGLNGLGATRTRTPWVSGGGVASIGSPSCTRELVIFTGRA